MMGNEMGNNNTSGLREEDNTIPEAEQIVHVNDLEAENHAVLTPKSKDYHQNVTGIASHDPTRTLNGTEQVPVESPEAEQKLSEESGKESEFQSTEELADIDNSNSSNLEDTVLEINKLQTENLYSFNKEEVSELSTTFAYDEESEDFAEQKSGQHEFKEVEADQLSEQESSNSARGVKENGGLSDIPSNSKENGHASDTHISGYLEGTVSPNAKGIGEKTDGEIPIEKNSNGSNYLEQEKTDMMDHLVCSDVDLSVPEDKCIILTEESESTDNKHDDNESESEIDRENASETDSSIMPNCNNHEKEDPLITSHEATTNGNWQVEEVKLADESEERCEGSEGEIVMIHEVGMLANGQNSKDETGDDESVSRTFEESDDQNKDSEGKIMMVHGHEWFAAEPFISNESRDCKPEAYEAELPITNGTNNKEESEDYKTKEEEPVNKQSLVKNEKKEAPCPTKKDTDERENGNEFISQQFPVAAEDHRGSSESNPEMKLESSSECLATKAINIPATRISVENLISTVDLPIEKPEEEVSAHVTAAPEMVTTSENHSREQKSIFEIDSCNGIREEVQKSPNFTTESTLSAVEKAQQEVPYYKTEVIETVKLSASANQSSDERISTESIPEYLNARAEMRKSPSFDIDLRRSEESDQAPLLYQNNENISLQTSLLAVEKNEDMPAERKVITLERSDSEKSRTPFLGLKKEEEETHTPKKEDKHEPAKKATKSKEKHKRRSSLFTNCMCCTTVIH